MKVVIRADASGYIGSGHIMRCLVLAKAWQKRGHDVSFACRCQQGDLVDFIRQKGVIVHELCQPLEWKVPAHTADYSSWLQVSEQEDAESLITKVEVADLVVVDHYGLSIPWEQSIKRHYQCPVMAIDDLVRPHDCDLLLDQTLNRRASDYKHSVPDEAILLTGCEYAVLNPFFVQGRERALDKPEANSSHRVLVSMGGSDLPNATLLILKQLSSLQEHFEHVTVVLNPRAKHFTDVEAFIRKNSPWVSLVEHVDNMAELMLAHTVAVGAPGTTSWERACLGLPSIIIPLAENQQTISENLAAADAAITLALEQVAGQFASAFHRLLAGYTQLRHRNMQLCDGLGVARVIEQVERQLLCSSEPTLGVVARLAREEDIRQVYNWQCQPETRRFALTPETPSWDDHCLWMKKRLALPGSFFYILEKGITGKEAVGVVRLDRQSAHHYLISIFVDANYHRQGIASQALSWVDAVHPDITIHATVLAGNIASQTTFLRAGYTRLSEEQFLRHPIKHNLVKS